MEKKVFFACSVTSAWAVHASVCFCHFRPACDNCAARCQCVKAWGSFHLHWILLTSLVSMFVLLQIACCIYIILPLIFFFCRQFRNVVHTGISEYKSETSIKDGSVNSAKISPILNLNVFPWRKWHVSHNIEDILKNLRVWNIGFPLSQFTLIS